MRSLVFKPKVKVRQRLSGKMAGSELDIEMPSKYTLLTLPAAEFADNIRAYTMHDGLAQVFEGKLHFKVCFPISCMSNSLVHLISLTGILLWFFSLQLLLSKQFYH